MFYWEDANFINPLPPPEVDTSHIGYVKSLQEDVEPHVPKFMVTFKHPVEFGYIRKICIYNNGYWHSLDGWNYSHKQVQSYENLGVDFDWHTLGTTRWYSPKTLERLTKTLTPLGFSQEEIERLDNGKIHQIEEGIKNGLSYEQVSVYSKGYSSPQMQQLRLCFEEKLSNEQISLIANPQISSEHMQIMRTGFKARMSYEEISAFLDPSENWWIQFQKIRKEAERRKTMRQRIFIDMDGTLCVFNPTKKLEDLYEQFYFLNLKPYENMVEFVKILIRDYSDQFEVFILSSYLSDSHFALNEKNQWLDKYLPEIDAAHRLFIPCGIPKKEAVPHGLRDDDLLLDDYTTNLYEWCPPGLAGKILNDINDRHKTWNGPRIDKNDSPEVITANVIKVAGRDDIEPPLEETENDIFEISDEVDESAYDPYAGQDVFECDPFDD